MSVNQLEHQGIRHEPPQDESLTFYLYVLAREVRSGLWTSRRVNEVINRLNGKKLNERNKVNPDIPEQVRQLFENLRQILRRIKSDPDFAFQNFKNGTPIRVNEYDTYLYSDQVPEVIELLLHTISKQHDKLPFQLVDSFNTGLHTSIDGTVFPLVAAGKECPEMNLELSLRSPHSKAGLKKRAYSLMLQVGDTKGREYQNRILQEQEAKETAFKTAVGKALDQVEEITEEEMFAMSSTLGFELTDKDIEFREVTVHSDLPKNMRLKLFSEALQEKYSNVESTENGFVLFTQESRRIVIQPNNEYGYDFYITLRTTPKVVQHDILSKRTEIRSYIEKVVQDYFNAQSDTVSIAQAPAVCAQLVRSLLTVEMAEKLGLIKPSDTTKIEPLVSEYLNQAIREHFAKPRSEN